MSVYEGRTLLGREQSRIASHLSSTLLPWPPLYEHAALVEIARRLQTAFASASQDGARHPSRSKYAFAFVWGDASAMNFEGLANWSARLNPKCVDWPLGRRGICRRRISRRVEHTEC